MHWLYCFHLLGPICLSYLLTPTQCLFPISSERAPASKELPVDLLDVNRVRKAAKALLQLAIMSRQHLAIQPGLETLALRLQSIHVAP